MTEYPRVHKTSADRTIHGSTRRFHSYAVIAAEAVQHSLSVRVVHEPSICGKALSPGLSRTFLSERRFSVGLFRALTPHPGGHAVIV